MYRILTVTKAVLPDWAIIHQQGVLINHSFIHFFDISLFGKYCYQRVMFFVFLRIIHVSFEREHFCSTNYSYQKLTLL